MTVEGVDYSYGRPDPSRLYEAGKRFACRYLAGEKPGKAVSRAEVDALHGAGLSVVLNWELTRDEAAGGFAMGVDRASRAAPIVAELGAPADAVVYFSVDYDARDMVPVEAYFRGITSVWPWERTGVYGGRRVVEAAQVGDWCPYYWQTYGWSSGVWVGGVHIQQYLNAQTFEGHPIDLDRAMGFDYGQWKGAPVATWYLNRALTNFRAAVNVAYPSRDKESDGTIGDPAHAARSSDHNPDPDGSVDAWDMDVDLRSGDDPATVEHLKAVFQVHEASSYWIHNDVICRRADSWRRRSYPDYLRAQGVDPSGRNTHTKHVHWNSREAYEDSNAPWIVEDDMAGFGFRTQAQADAVFDALNKQSGWKTPGEGGITRSTWQIIHDLGYGTLYGVGPWEGKDIQSRFATLAEKLDELAARPAATVDVAALAAAIVDKLPPTGLSRDDVESAVKEALREGTGA